MDNTKVTLALTVSRHDGPFPSEAAMLIWMNACLNCNTNHAAVTIEKVSSPDSITRVDDAFGAVNTLLDASGALDSEPLKHAVYALRLEIARAAGDTDRAKAAEESLQELALDVHENS